MWRGEGFHTGDDGREVEGGTSGSTAAAAASAELNLARRYDGEDDSGGGENASGEWEDDSGVGTSRPDPAQLATGGRVIAGACGDSGPSSCGEERPRLVSETKTGLLTGAKAV